MASPFDPAQYLYLNPDIVAFSNVLTVEDARNVYFEPSNASTYGSLPYEVQGLPTSFDANVFIADKRSVIDTSTLNQTIRAAMLNTGYTSNEITQHFSKYIGTIYEKVYLVSNNYFGILYDELGEANVNYRFNACNLNCNDNVRIIKNNGEDYIYGRVTEVTDSNFRIQPQGLRTVGDASASYILYGIELVDFERNARANLSRLVLQSNIDYELLFSPGRVFNPPLYQTLYPDARMETYPEAYVDYVNKYTAQQYRVASGEDIIHRNVPLVILYSVQLASNLFVGNKALLCSNMQVTRSNCAINSNLSAAASNLQVTSNALTVRSQCSFASSNVLITSNAARVSTDAYLLSNVYLGAASWTVRVDGATSNLVATPPGGASNHPRSTVFSPQGTVAFGQPLDGTAADVTPYVMYANGPTYVNSDIYVAGTMITQSDARKKTNISRLNTHDVCKRLRRLRGYRYTLKADTCRRPHIGLMAQEVGIVFPELVHTDKFGTMHIAYGNMVALLVDAFDHLSRRVDHLATRSRKKSLTRRGYHVPKLDANRASPQRVLVDVEPEAQ